MTQKEVDAIVLEIFNICREKGLNFQLHQTGYAEVQYFDFETNTFKLNERACINVNNPIFNYKAQLSISVTDLLEQVKQYKK
jgi:hypothetical protein